MEPDPDGIGRYAVIAGGRRLAAMQALAADGALEEDHPVPCRMIGGIVAAEEVSLAENSVRAAMHPADQVEAFRRLADAGSTAAAIAARFGVSERTVEKRLRLGNAAPVLLEAYRAGEIDLETLMAFAVTTDQDAPERGLGDGEPTGLPARRLADQAPADRGPGSGHVRHRAFRRHRGLRGGGRQGSTATCSPRKTSGGSGSTIPIS